MSLHALAGHMATKGRNGDSVLVHMAPSEVAGLHALALAHGEKLTINPETGLPEAFKLKSLLPIVLGAALGPAGLGLSTMMSAGIVGAGYGLAKGSLKEGLIAGLGAYGGAGLASSLGAAGVSEAAAQEAFKNQLGQQVALDAPTQTMYGAFGEAPLGAAADAATTTTASTTGAAGAPVAGAESAAAPAQTVLTPVETVTPPVAGPTPDPGALSTAGYTPPTGLEALKQGAESIYDKGTFGDFAKANKSNLYAIGASAAMAPEDEEGAPETKRDPGYIRPARYNWRTGTYEYFDPVKASEWGTRNLSEYTNARDPNARTPIGRKGGGLLALANGGAIAFADGGMTPEQLRAQIEAGPRTQAALDQAFATYSPAQLAAAFPEFGGVEQYTQAAAEARARNAAAQPQSAPAPAADSGGFTAGPVVGPGALPDNYTIPGGTTAQGYSRDYTPEQRIGINQAYIRSQQDPNYGVKGLMADMEKYGVNAKDIALSYGMGEHGVDQYLTRGGASADFGGINAGWDTQKQDEFIKWQNSQPNPAGQGTMGDVYKKQGISDDSPIRRAQAQEIIERQAARKSLRDSVVLSGGVPGPTTPGPTTPGPTTPGPTTPGPTTPGPSNPQQPVPTTPTIDASTTGGSRDAYKYLSGQGPYPTNPYLPPNTPIGKPIFETPGYEALKPKEAKFADELKNPNATPKTAPPVGKKWVWNPTDRKWVTEALITPPPGTNGNTGDAGGASGSDGASTGDTGGNAGASGSADGSAGGCVDPNVMVLLAAGGHVRAGDLRVGDMLHTLHEDTFVYGNFPVEFVEIIQQPKVEVVFDGDQKIVVSTTHKFLTADGVWKPVRDLAIGDVVRALGAATKKLTSVTALGEGPVVKMTVTDAHTYIADGLVSHNKARGGMVRRMALGGLGALAGGGAASQYNLGDYSDGGRLLKGPGDGVSDNIPATIGGKQPARLADGEFVVPARIVSELGNGSTDAGARKLYAMMDRVQKARGKTTGKNRVAANSRADKYLPA